MVRHVINLPGLADANRKLDLILRGGGGVIVPPPAPTLQPLSLSAPIVSGTASTGTISGLTAGSMLAATLAGLTVNRADETYSFDGSPAAGTSGSLVEMLAGAANSPQVTAVTVEAPAVAPLTITGTPPATGTVGQPYSFTPSAAGGAGTKVYALASGTLLAGLSLNASSGAITGTPTAAGTMTDLSVRVTDDTGSASTVPTTVTIAAATTPGTVTVDPLVTRNGQQYNFTARRTGDVSQPASRTMQVAASTDYPPGSPASDWPNGTYASATANFPAGSPTAPFTITAPVAAQPE